MRVDPERVFTPAAPVVGPPAFVGREQALREADAALDEPGRHLIVLAEAGVGRTSFALTCAGKRPTRYYQAGLQPHLETLMARLAPDAEAAVDDAAEAGRVLVVDDIDSAPERLLTDGLIPLLRSLSDRRSAARLVLTARRDRPIPSGLGGAGARLRALVLERLDPSSLRRIIDNGADATGLAFEDPLAKRIVMDADGLPGMVHALCLEAARSALARGSQHVRLGRDFVNALQGVVGSVEPQLRRSYERATTGRGRTNRVTHLLWAGALSQGTSFGLTELEEQIARIEGKAVSQQAFAVHLGKLLRQGIFERLREGRYRVADPALRAYVRLRLRDEHPRLAGDDPLQLALPL